MFTILVSGFENVAEVVFCLIGLRDKLKGMFVKEDLLFRFYSRVIVDLKKEVVELKLFKEYFGFGFAFVCIFYIKGIWLCIESEKISISVFRFLYEVMRVYVLYGRYNNDIAVFEVVFEYFVERFRFVFSFIFKVEG